MPMAPQADEDVKQGTVPRFIPFGWSDASYKFQPPGGQYDSAARQGAFIVIVLKLCRPGLPESPEAGPGW